jgi:methyl-accepting chemotaxis protein
MAFNRHSILTKILVYVGVAVLALFIFLTLVLSGVNTASQKKKFDAVSLRETQLLAYALTSPVYDFDMSGIESVTTGFIAGSEYVSVAVFDDKDKALFTSPVGKPRGKTVKTSIDLAVGEKKIGRIDFVKDTWSLTAENRVTVLGYSLMAFAMVSCMLFLIVSLLRAVVLKPIRQLDSTVVGLSKGDGDLTQRLPILHRDELGKVSGDFNSFLEMMRDLVSAIRKSLDSLLEIKERIGNSTYETNSSLGEINANLAGIQKQIDELNRQITSASSSVEEISANISSMKRTTEHQAQAVASSTSAVNQMVASIGSVAKITEAKKQATRRLLEVTESGGANLAETIEIVREINAKVGTISELTKIINKISAQTNLLAMNAAIEAAHAGEAGAGFSVVAGEIRILAENSRGNAKNIGDILKDMTAKIALANTQARKTGEVFELVKKDVNGVSEAFGEISDASRELNEGGSQIVESMAKLQEISVLISQGSNEIEAGTRDLRDNMLNANSVSSEIVVGMKEITAGSENIAKSLNGIQDQSNALDGASEELSARVNRFKV